MKSIQGVSIWKILGSFLVLTLCLSEAQSGQTEETIEVVRRPKGILKMSSSMQGLSSDSSLDQSPEKTSPQKRVEFSADTVGGEEPNPYLIKSTPPVIAAGEEPNPYLIKRPPHKAEEEPNPFSTEMWESIRTYKILIAWMPLFSVPFVNDVISLATAFFGGLPPYKGFNFPIVQRIDRFSGMFIYTTLKSSLALILTAKVYGLLGKKIHSKILASKNHEESNLPPFIKDLITSIQRNQYRVNDQTEEASYWESTRRLYLLSLPLLLLGPVTNYLGYSSYTGYDLFLTTLNLTALFLTHYPYFEQRITPPPVKLRKD